MQYDVACLCLDEKTVWWCAFDNYYHPYNKTRNCQNVVVHNNDERENNATTNFDEEVLNANSKHPC